MIFLDADDDIADGFIAKRWQEATASQADVVLFNGWHSGAGDHQSAIHRKQPCGKILSGHDWIRHCVTQREWPHYLWLQMVRSSYISQYALHFQPGKSHKDILWTIQLAAANGWFYFSDRQDYFWVNNPSSITHRPDYYDIRAVSYTDVIADILALSIQPQYRAVRRTLVRHALVESRHFLGLYRRKVSDRQTIRAGFRARIPFHRCFTGAALIHGYCSTSGTVMAHSDNG